MNVPEPSHFGRDGKANVDAFESMSSGNGGGGVFGMPGVLSVYRLPSVFDTYDFDAYDPHRFRQDNSRRSERMR